MTELNWFGWMMVVVAVVAFIVFAWAVRVISLEAWDLLRNIWRTWRGQNEP
jgi:hypothetical protein